MNVDGAEVKNGNRGGWTLSKRKCYLLDIGLANGVLSIVKNTKKNLTIADIGAGLGCYSNFYHLNGLHIVHSSDFAVDIDHITKGYVLRNDATLPIHFDPFPDWVFSVEVGEHIPQKGTNQFIENLQQSQCGIILG